MASPESRTIRKGLIFSADTARKPLEVQRRE